MAHSQARNVLGTELTVCCQDPVTGFYRDGYCRTGPEDLGSHTVCAQVDRAFLDYSREQGNDLSTARPEIGFQGLRPGDYWCLCAERWWQAHEAGVAPRLKLTACDERALDVIALDVLKAYALDLN